MELLILAGGFGTRLRTVVADVPKALAPIGNVPFLQFQLENWLAQGLRRFTFLLHHQADQIIAFLKERENGLLDGCEVDWIIEAEPLDTGGAVAHAVKKLKLSSDFLMVNADTWLGNGMSEIMEAAAPAMAVVELSNASRYGQVRFDQRNYVTAFVEKAPEAAAGWINAGLCHLSADLFVDWDGTPFSLERDLFSNLVKKQDLKAVVLNTDFIDIGVPVDYNRFCNWVAAGRLRPLCN